MSALLSGITNLMNNPIWVGIGALLIGTLFFILKGPLLTWLQSFKTKQNQADLTQGSAQASTENEDLNQNINKDFP